ncbi:MAG: hypothetical protein IM650_12165, partial [Phenylobacterium sp.]
DIGGVLHQRVKIGVGADGSAVDVSETNPMPVADNEAGNLLLRILQMLMAPLGYDKSLQRQRSTAVIESGTVTTVSTVSTVSTVTTVSGLTNITGNIGNYQANQQVWGQNNATWAACVRSCIT